MKIEVTQEDIDKGLKSDCYNCPVARAVKRATGAERVEISPLVIIIGERWVSTPSKAAFFINGFDDSKTVKPFTFDLPIEP